MATLVALGPGDPDLVPLAAWRVLEAAGPVAVPDDEPLAAWLGEHGIAIDPDAPVAAASGERFRRLLAERDWEDVVPRGAALRDLLLADAMVGLQRLTERLRVDCPWDREQTAATIVPHTIEEAYEVAEAVGGGDAAKLVDELGDLLFQTFFLALLCEEDGTGDLAEVAAGITEKLIRRHPHVFGEREAETAGAVRRNWEQIKRDDEGRAGVFHDVPGRAAGAAPRPQGAAAGVGGRLRLGRLGRRVARARVGARRASGGARCRAAAACRARARRRRGRRDSAISSSPPSTSRGWPTSTPSSRCGPPPAGSASRVEEAERLAAEAGETWTELDLDAQDAWYRRAKEALHRA